MEQSYSALSSLEDVIAMLRSVSSVCLLKCSEIIKQTCDTLVLWVCFQDTSIDPSEVFNRIVSSVCSLLTKDEVGFMFIINWNCFYFCEILFLLNDYAACSYVAWLHCSSM